MSEIVLEATNLTRHYQVSRGGFKKPSTLKALDGATFTLEKGKTLDVVGESGSGKSVTAMSVLNLIPDPPGKIVSGEINFKGTNLVGLPMEEMQKIRCNSIGMIFQEPMTALNPLHTVEKQISEILELHQGLRKQGARNKTIELLELVKIHNPEQRLKHYPHELSGGQRQRVMIAMALANTPELLIADEPTTALDVTVQRSIMELLQQLKSDLGMAMLLITHDLGMVKHHAESVVVMHQGKLVETAITEDLFTQPQADYTKKLLTSDPKGSPVTVKDSSEIALGLDNLQVKFPLNKPLFGKPTKFLQAVKGASVEVPKGTTLGVVGESGSGKTTLAMALLRLAQSEGEIRFNGQSINMLDGKAMRPLRKSLQVVFQDPFASLSPRMTVAQIVAEGLKVHLQLTDDEMDQQVVTALLEVGLDPETRHRYPHEFSGGQRQRIAIARAVILDPELIVLDEPTSALDRAVQVQVLDLLRDLQEKRGLTYVFISHDLKVVKALSHQVIVMKEGDIVEQGCAQKVLSEPGHAYTQALLEAVF